MRPRPPIAALTTLVLAAGLGVATAAPADADPDGQTSSAPLLEVDFPGEQQRVSGRDVPFHGTVRLDDAPDQITRVQYVVDVSGSTASPLQDCNGDGVLDALDDFNGDGRFGDVLDCQISAVVALNADLRGVPGSAEHIRVGLTAFGSTAAVAQMVRDEDIDAELDDATFIAPGTTGDGKDVIPNVNVVASSLRVGVLGEYERASVGSGTNFDAALGAALDSLEPHAGPRWIFLLSDGQATVSPHTLNRVAASGVGVRTFAVGNGAGTAPCAAPAALAQIVAAGSDACVRVVDPASLTTSLIASQPGWLDSVEVEIDGRTLVADIDPIGGWSLVVPGLDPGYHRATVTATLTDGQTVTRIRGFRVADHISYVALGDSYASGEGIRPYLQGPQDNLCHRSSGSWPGMVSVPGSTDPLSARKDADFQFLACSGARIVNLDTEPQPKNMWSGGRIEIPRQLDLLRRDADLVTLSIGGNDLGFAPIMIHCFTSLECQDHRFITTSSDTNVSLDDWMAVRLALVGNELTGTYQAIRSRVSADTAVVATTYPRLVSDWDNAHAACSPLMLSKDERRWLRRQVDAFAGIVQDRARRTGADVHVADVRDDFDGRNFCDRDSAIIGPTLWRPWTDVEFGLTSAASFHPTERGARLYAAAVDETLRHDVDVPRAGATRALAETSSLPTSTTGAAISPVSTPAVPASVRSTTVRTAPDPVTDPDGLLATYPDDVVSAVGSTAFADVALGNGAGLDGSPACEHVVTREIVPLRALGFDPGSTVTATTRAIGHDDETWPDAVVSEHVVAEDGRLESEIVAPPITGEGILTVSLSGVGPGGGPVIGTALASTSDDPECAALVQAAGRVAPEEVERPLPDSSPTRPAAADDGAADRHALGTADAVDEASTTPAGLALTGGALLVALLVAASAIVALGVVVLRGRGRSRTGA